MKIILLFSISALSFFNTSHSKSPLKKGEGPEVESLPPAVYSNLSFIAVCEGDTFALTDAILSDYINELNQFKPGFQFRDFELKSNTHKGGTDYFIVGIDGSHTAMAALEVVELSTRYARLDGMRSVVCIRQNESDCVPSFENGIGSCVPSKKEDGCTKTETLTMNNTSLCELASK
jgi:hypothetical protein